MPDALTIADAAEDAPTGLETVNDWLLYEAWRIDDIQDIMNGFCERLVGFGLRIVRVGAIIGTLHPRVKSYYFIWQRGKGIAEHSGPHGIESEPDFKQSPFPDVLFEGLSIRRRLEGDGKLDYPILETLRAEGATDYIALPMEFGAGERNGLSFAMDRAGGFTNRELKALYPLIALLGRVLETKALRRTAVNLLDTYLGHDTGERILGGQIRRGDMDTMRAVLWYCDLRGFTTLSESLPGGEVIELLNDYFQAMGSAVSEGDGEVLKFIGDAMLAVFRPRQTDSPRQSTCDRALAAAQTAVANLAGVNAARREQGKPELIGGLALHVGDVLYGNIGAQDRLDFTVIGPAVNLVSRIEHLCLEHGQPLVMSADFAAMLSRPARSLGRHKLRGIAEAQEIFAPEQAH